MAHTTRAPASVDAELEREVRTRLRGSDADTERVLELARDVQRVVAGELSEREFQARHCEEKASGVR